MSEYVDRKEYVVTLHAEYRAASRYCGPRFVSGETTIFQSTPIISAEPILDPLPTAPGSVILVDWGLPRWTTSVLLGDGNWSDDDGETWNSSSLSKCDWTLIYDAGATND